MFVAGDESERGQRGSGGANAMPRLRSFYLDGSSEGCDVSQGFYERTGASAGLLVL